MKTARYLFSLLFAVFILFVVSCSGSDGVESFETAFDRDYDPSKTPTFAGERLITNGFERKSGACEYLDETELSDLVLKRISDVEKKLDLKIDVVYDNTGYEEIIMSGATFADVMMYQSFWMVSTVRAGLVMDITGIIDVTDTEKYGNPTHLTSCFWKNGQFAVLPLYWPESIYNCVNYLLGVNENLVKRMGLTDPRDYSDQGLWTWDSFEKFLMEATQDMGDKTVYGMGIHPPYFAEMFERSAGGNLYYMDENGDVSIGWYRNSNSVAALVKAQQLFNGDTAYCFYPSQDVYLIYNEFLADSMVLTPILEGKMFGGEDSVVYQMENAGIVQWPYEKSREDSLCSIHASMYRVAYVPINAYDPDASGAFISEVFEPLEGYETKDSLKNYLNRSVFFDDRDSTLFLEMADRCFYTFFIDGARILEEQTIGYEGHPKDVFEALDSLESVYDKYLTKYIVPTFEGMKTVWSPEQIRSFFNMK